MKDHVIIAPHADDEIIGCYELLKTGQVTDVYFGSEKAMEEAVNSSEYFGFSVRSIDSLPMLNRLTYLFPDPTNEIHPLHRHLGNVGVIMLRDGYKVIFYTTNMNVPYLHEVEKPELKHRDLEYCYERKKSLWQYDHKYFLFEGYTQWIMKI